MTILLTKQGRVKFSCPDCNGDILEEVLTNVTQSTHIDIIEGASADYDSESATYDDGEVSHIECYNCGKIIVDESLFDDYDSVVDAVVDNDWWEPLLD